LPTSRACRRYRRATTIEYCNVPTEEFSHYAGGVRWGG
jgi:hypothetical protein